MDHHKAAKRYSHLLRLSIRLELIRFASMVITAKYTARDLIQQVFEKARILFLRLGNGAFQILHLRLCRLVAELSHYGVKEVYTTKGTSNQGIYWTSRALQLHLCSTTYVWEHITLAEFDQSQFGIVAMS